ncbi:MAG: gliding motility-associated C-terminal domain-containing protein [Bacteroidia bacterium]|nr:gliding motility-associated C-terminal domain-containing protein [Bacteroidia bacterium]
MRKIINSLLLLIFLVASKPVAAQIDTVFWFAAPWITVGHANRVPIVMRISTFNQPTTVRIQQPAGTYDTTFTIAANSLFSKFLSHIVNQVENSPADVVHNRGLKITSDFPITVVYEIVTSGNNPETYSLKGQNGMGYEFVCPFQTQRFNWAFSPIAKSQIDVVATQNNTVVWITPRCNVVGHAANVTYSIMLNAGQSYAIENVTNNTNVPGQNLSGTIVVADKPISVTVTDDSVRGVTGCMDALGDQIVPVEVVGMNYIINKGGLYAAETEGAYIVATQNFTQVNIDDGVVTTVLLNKGDTYYYHIANPLTYITSDKNIYVIHVSGFGCEMGEAIIPPLNCAGSEQISFTRTNAQTFILNVLCKTTATGNFLLNGNATLVPASAFTVVPGTGGLWSGAQITYSTSQIPVGVTNLLRNTHPVDSIFSMGVINGGAGTGCYYHYMSSFLRRVYTNAGIDQNICTATTQTISLSGTVDGGAVAGVWTTTNGTGTFANPNNLSTTYTLSPSDFALPQVKFVLSSVGNCTPVRDTVVLNVFQSPTVNAGLNQSLCKNNISNIPINGSVAMAAGSNWTTSGSGSFGNPGALSTTYLPSPADLSNDSVKIYLTSTGSMNGCPNKQDSLMLYFTPSPTIAISPVTSMCANNATIVISGTVTGATNTGIWSGGAGSYNPGTTSLTNTYVPTPTEIATGSVNIVLASTNNGNCKVVKDSIQVSFTPAPVVQPGSNLLICRNNPSSVLSGTVSGPTTTGIWSGGSGTFNPNNTTLNAIYVPTPAELAAGSVTLTLSSTGNGNCNQVQNSMVINFTNPASVGAGSDISVCKNNPLPVVNGSISGPTTTGVWTGGTGLFSPSNAALTATYTPSPAEIAAGTTTLVLTSTNNGNCNQVTDTVIVNFTNAPVVNAGFDLSICRNNINTSISGTVTGPTTTGNWTGGAGTYNPGSSALTSTYTPTPAELAAGSVTLTLVSTNNGNCNQEQDQLVINFTNPAVVAAGLDISACKNNANVALNGSVSGVTSTGIWSGGTGTFTPGNTSLNTLYSPTASEIAAGTATLILTSTSNNNCNPVTDTILINFTNPATVDAGTNISLCQNNVTTPLNGNVSGITTTGVWIGGSGTFNPNNTTLNANYTPSPSEISAGTASLVLQSTNNGNCNQITDTVYINFTSPPVVNAGVDIFTCRNNINTVISGVVSGPTSTGTWSGGMGTFNPGSSALTTTYTPSAIEVAAGSVTLTLTSTNNGNCNQVQDQVVINFSDPATVAAGPDISACINNANVSLNGSVSGITTTGLWSGGTGTYTPSNTSLNTLYSPSAAELALGSTTLILNSTNNSGCNSVTDTLILSFTNAPVVAAGNDMTLCKNNVLTALTGTVSGATTTGVWVGGSGSYNPSSAALTTSYTPSASEISSGTATLVLQSTNNGNCNQVVDTVLIHFTNEPVVYSGPDITVCANNPTIAISGTVTAGTTTGVWSTSGGGSFSPSTTSLTSVYNIDPADIAQGSITIKLTSTNNGNCNAVSDSLVVNITPKPTVDAGLNDTICANQMFYPLNGSVTNGASAGVWTTLGNGTFGNPNNLSTTYTLGQADTTAGVVKIVLTSTGGNCLPETDTLQIVLAKIPQVDAGPNNMICDNERILLNGSVIGLTTTGVWTTLGTGVFTPDDSLLTTYYQPSPLDVANGYVNLVLTSTYNKGCLAVTDTVRYTFKPTPVSDFNSNNVCAKTATSFTDTSVPTASLTGSWWDFGDMNTSTVNNPTHAFTNPGTYTVTHVVYSNNGCNDTIKKTIDVYFLPQAFFYNSTSCVGNSTQFVDSSKTLSGNIIQWQWNFGDSQTSSIQNPQHGFATPTVYTVSLVVTSSLGCKDTIQKAVTVISGPTADFSINPNPVQSLETVNFTDLSTGPASLTNWYWQFGDSMASNEQNPTHIYNTQGDLSVFLVVKDINGCIDTVRKDITVILLPDVPTAFSPNGDGQNDIFRVRGGPFKSINFRVYNNWGQLIFETNDQKQGWDGTYQGIDQPLGVYVWVVDVEMLSGKQVKKTGDVTLLR